DGGASRPVVGLLEDFRVVLDADGDGDDEAIALLWSSSGGSGTFDYLALMGRENEQIVNLGTAELGDRVSIRSYEVKQGRLVLEVVQAGPGDARCCPGEKARRSWAWIDNQFSELQSEPLGRLSLADLEGVEWVLERLTWKEPVASEPAITLSFQDRNLSGLSGCNRFQATVDEGDLPGDLKIGPVAATSRSCGDPIDALEMQFLEALSGVNRYSFMVGKLVLSWSHGGQWNTMVLAPRPLTAQPKP
ncbi:MAG: META domain-containing protein, partial [Acidobacteriota bacterium]